MKKILVFAVMLICSAIFAEIRMSTLFSDGMMIQSGEEVLIWGFCAPNCELALEFNGERKKTMSEENGKWQLKIGPFSAGIKGSMTILSGEDKKKISDIITGEICFASGQSNMDWPVAKSLKAEEEIKNAVYPEIRFFKLQNTVSREPIDELTVGIWEKVEPKTVPKFSAVAYFFAREMHKSKNVPIGIIQSAWGGTPIESWMSNETLSAKEIYSPILERAKNIPADIDELKKMQQASTSGERREEFIKDSGIAPEAANFANAAFDDQGWKKINLPQYWEKPPLNIKVDGAFWFRKKININLKSKIKSAKISLGAIDDFDITYFNGEKIGETDASTENHWTVPRNYEVPVKLITNEENTIAVRVFDHYGSGGFAGGSEDMKIIISYDDGSVVEIPLNGLWRYYIERQVDEPKKITHPCHRASSLYNAMVHPVAPYSLRGYLWYQGESNVSRAYQYRELLPDMINSWRKLWGETEKPFLIVQLANFMNRNEKYEASAWAELREAQLLSFKNTPNTGLAVIIDIGEEKDIHPKNKQEVGKRLALWARKLVYNDDIICSGPIFKDAQFKDGKAIVSFNYVGDGLKSSDGSEQLSGFVIAGKDKVFYNAEAKIVGNNVIVQSSNVPEPVSVRYAWANNPPASLYNSAGLPASPFRSDEWLESTANNK